LTGLDCYTKRLRGTTINPQKLSHSSGRAIFQAPTHKHSVIRGRADFSLQEAAKEN
jgi:hypothetical protein